MSIPRNALAVLIDALEPRRHLSTEKLLTVDGLPRELTAVGDVVYFARDSGRDGHLSFPELVSYNVKTGERGQVTRDNGKAFGTLQYTLASDGQRLLIVERHAVKHATDPITSELWTLRPGETRAHSIYTSTDVPTQLNEQNMIHVGSTTYVGRERLFAIDKKDRVSFALSVGDLANMHGLAEVDQMVNWQGRLAFTAHYTPLPTATDDSPADGPKRLFVVTGAPTSSGGDAPIRELTLPVKKSQRAYDQIAVLGDRLLATNIMSRFNDEDEGLLFTSDGLDAGLIHRDRSSFSTSTFATDHVTFLGSAGKVAIIVYTGMGILTPLTVATDFTAGGTRELYADYYERPARFFAVGSNICFTDLDRVGDASEPYDPETVGGYVASHSLGAGSVAMNLTNSNNPGLYGLNFDERRIDYLKGTEFILHLVNVGSSAYFMSRPVVPSSLLPETLTDRRGELFITDGTALGTARVDSAYRGPVVAGGQAVYTNAFDSSTIHADHLDYGVLGGSINSIDRSGISRSSTGLNLVHRWVFIDADGDGTRDADEPHVKTNGGGAFSFGVVKPKRYRVAVERFNSHHWTLLNGWSRLLRVGVGRATAARFQFADRQRSASITGQVLSNAGPAAGREVRLMIPAPSYPDIYAVHRVIAARTLTDAEGRFTFDGLTAGYYAVDYDPDNRIDHYPQNWDFFVNVGETQDVKDVPSQ